MGSDERGNRRQLPVLRRMSSGGDVWHGLQLHFCVVCSRLGEWILQVLSQGKETLFLFDPHERTKLARLPDHFSVLSHAVQPHTVTYGDGNKPEIKRHR